MITIEEAQIKYNEHFKRGVPFFMELSEDAQKEVWFIEAILKAIAKNNPDINIDGHYDTSVIY